MPKLQGITLFNALVMSAVRTESWYRKVLFTQEVEFRRDDSESLGALLITLGCRTTKCVVESRTFDITFDIISTLDYLIENRVGYIFYMIRDVFVFEGYLVVSWFRVFP